jgi:hypothetical protein
MRPLPAVFIALLLIAGGCASPRNIRPATAGLGVVESSDGTGAGKPAHGAEPVLLPDRIVIPAAYRLMLLDGHLALVRVSDEQALAPAPPSLRIVMGELARGELAYQPGLLPQELASEVAANRESSARMDNALETVMRRSRELSEQALQLKSESTRLAELLQAARARIAELEASPGKPPSQRVSPGDPPPGPSN